MKTWRVSHHYDGNITTDHTKDEIEFWFSQQFPIIPFDDNYQRWARKMHDEEITELENRGGDDLFNAMDIQDGSIDVNDYEEV
jgi:hypothetical protein